MTAIGETFYIDLVRRIMILAIAAVSLNLILGYGGLVSFGHAAYLGIGAYAVGILAFYGITSGWLQWAVADRRLGARRLAIGAVSIRTSGIYFIMITLAFTQMLYYLGISLEEFGGDDGMRLKAKSQFSGLVDLREPITFYYLALVLMLACVYVVSRIVNSRFGMVLRAASRTRRARAPSASRPTLTRLAVRHGRRDVRLAGALYANHTNYITPGLMSWQHGRHHVHGDPGRHGEHRRPRAWRLRLHLHGGIPQGAAQLDRADLRQARLGGVPRCSWARFVLRSSSSAAGWRGSSTSLMLEVRGLTKTFGALRACDGIDFEVREGETHAVIGPNGAGKTTFISQLAGNLHARRRHGALRRRGHHTPARAPRARKGLARSFQITSVFPDFSALHNVALAVQAFSRRTGLRRPARATPRSSSRRAVARAGRLGRAPTPAVSMSHGEHRQLEVAMALATEPRLLLLDEPMAGMGVEESQRMIGLLGRLKQARPSSWSSTTWTRCSASPTASRCWSTGASSRPACPRRFARTKRYAKRTSARPDARVATSRPPMAAARCSSA